MEADQQLAKQESHGITITTGHQSALQRVSVDALKGKYNVTLTTF